MTQLDLPLARRTDAATSHAAAKRAVVFKARHEAKIWQALKDYVILIPSEIAYHTGLDAVAVSRRGAGMVRKGLVSVGPDVREGCRVWRAA